MDVDDDVPPPAPEDGPAPALPPDDASEDFSDWHEDDSEFSNVGLYDEEASEDAFAPGPVVIPEVILIVVEELDDSIDPSKGRLVEGTIPWSAKRRKLNDGTSIVIVNDEDWYGIKDFVLPEARLATISEIDDPNMADDDDKSKLSSLEYSLSDEENLSSIVCSLDGSEEGNDTDLCNAYFELVREEFNPEQEEEDMIPCNDDEESDNDDEESDLSNAGMEVEEQLQVPEVAQPILLNPAAIFEDDEDDNLACEEQIHVRVPRMQVAPLRRSPRLAAQKVSELGSIYINGLRRSVRLMERDL